MIEMTVDSLKIFFINHVCRRNSKYKGVIKMYDASSNVVWNLIDFTYFFNTVTTQHESACNWTHSAHVKFQWTWKSEQSLFYCVKIWGQTQQHTVWCEFTLHLFWQHHPLRQISFSRANQTFLCRVQECGYNRRSQYLMAPDCMAKKQFIW